LIAACPDHKVCLFDVLFLFLRRCSLNESDSLLLAAHDVVVELFSVSSQPREGVNVAVLLLFLAFSLIVVHVASLLSASLIFVEHFELVAVQYFDTPLIEARQFKMVLY
jgi:hypothetical protein